MKNIVDLRNSGAEDTAELRRRDHILQCRYAAWVCLFITLSVCGGLTFMRYMLRVVLP